MTRVLIVDDSDTSRRLLRHIVQSAPDLEIVAELSNGKQVIQQIKKLKPDVILMDIVMPIMDGMEATGQVMAEYPTPIVMISGTVKGRETEMAFQALKRGALTLLSKPVGPAHPEFEADATKIVNTLRAMADVKVIHHLPSRRKTIGDSPDLRTPLQQTLNAPPEIVGITSSTGGPAALVDIFQQLPPDFSLPIVVVQHIAADFLPSLLSWLAANTPLPIQVAVAGQKPQPGITFAPVGQHLYFDHNQRFAFTDMPLVSHIPSGDMLFTSMAKVYGNAAVGVILTGMGNDGAQGLLKMHQAGAVTIAQNERTSAVYGMPKAAKQLGAVKYELSLGLIAPMLRDIVKGVLNDS